MEIIRKVKKIGGSLMLPLPPYVLEVLGAVEGTELILTLENDKLTVAPQKKKRYTLRELLAQCDPPQPDGDAGRDGDSEWVKNPPMGKEIL
jgi:antitoxin ChpS